jgi:hypothetical protein
VLICEGDLTSAWGFCRVQEMLRKDMFYCIGKLVKRDPVHLHKPREGGRGAFLIMEGVQRRINSYKRIDAQTKIVRQQNTIAIAYTR